MRIVEIDFESDPRWDEFVTGHPDGLVYHHSRWLSALWHEYGKRSRSRTRTNSCSFAVFCLSCTRRASQARGRRGVRRLSSLPRTPVAGPLALEPRTTVALLEGALSHVHEKPGTRLQVKTQQQIEESRLNSSKCRGELHTSCGSRAIRTSYASATPGTTPASNGRCRRRSGTVFASASRERRRSRGRYRLYLDVNRWQGQPPRAFRFFKAAWDSETRGSDAASPRREDRRWHAQRLGRLDVPDVRKHGVLRVQRETARGTFAPAERRSAMACHP